MDHFNKKSNEEQCKANKAIKDAVEDAQIALERNDVEKTKQALDKAMELLQERQNLILLADKSQYGWKTVLEYKHHDLADDEEDEKKIYRAESRAARSTKRFTSRSIPQRSNVTSTSTTPQLSASQLPNLFSRVNAQLSSQRAASGLCFACGKPGHWRAFCPNLRSNVPSNTAQNPKWLTSDVDLEQDLAIVHEDSDELIFLRVNGNSFEVKSGDDYSSVKGRLRGALAFWNDIHAPQFILDVIDYGYKLPLLQIPPPFTAKINSSALEQPAFVESAINVLIINGCVTEVFEAPVIINPLSVSVQKSGKKRLILDLRHVNQFLYKCRFRCEDLSIAKEVLNPGDFMFTFDLKSGYHHVEIFPEHRKYLSFAWTFSSGRTRFFQFSVLPFGLTSAPYLFTKLLKP